MSRVYPADGPCRVLVSAWSPEQHEYTNAAFAPACSGAPPHGGDRAEHRVDNLVPIGDDPPRAAGRTAPASRGSRDRRPAVSPACRRLA